MLKALNNFQLRKIYTIISKHFANETSAREEELVARFQKENKREFELLKKLWEKKNIEVIDFNSDRAWKKFMKISAGSKKPARIISIRSNFRKIAAAILLILVSSFAAYYILNHTGSVHQLIVQTNSNERIKKLILSDGSVVWLNKNTTFYYPQEFYGDKRSVRLEGQAFFEIAKNKKKPFIINTEYSNVKVVGTSFNINTSNFQTRITVKTGRVQVTSNIINKTVLLIPDQEAVASKDKLVQYQVRNKNYLAWKTGVFEFENAPLDQVVLDLNTYFDGQIMIQTEQLPDVRLNAKFNKADIDEVIKVLKTTCDLDIHQENNKYIIRHIK